MRKRLALVAVGFSLILLIWLLRGARQTADPTGGSRNPTSTLDHAGVTRPLTPPAVPPPPAKVEKPDGPEAAIHRLVSSVDWTSYSRAVIAFMRVQEDARRSGTQARQNPAMLEILARENQVLEQIAELLGLEDSRQIRFHERIAPDYAVGWLKALGLTLSAGQEQVLRDSARDFARSRAEAFKTMEGANRLERLAWEAEQGMRWDLEVRKVLMPDQFAQYAEPGGSDPFWGRQAERREFRVQGLDDAARQIEGHWLSAFGLREEDRGLLGGTASQLASEVRRQLTTFRARYPEDPPREETMRLQISLLQLQAKAERELGSQLRLSAAQLDRIGEGSGTVMAWKWE